MNAGVRLALALLVAAASAAAIEAPRFVRGPLPAEILEPARGLLAMLRDPIARSALEVAAGLLAALAVIAVPRWTRAAATFGIAGAAAIAAATTGLVLALPSVRASGAWALAVPAAAGSAGALLAPWLRDRGMISLLLVGLLDAAVLVPARHLALGETAAAHAFARARDAVLQTGLTRLYVSAGEELDLEFRRALACSLRPPRTEEAIDLLCVATDSVEEELLRNHGWAGVRIAGDALTDLAPEPPSPLDPVRFPFRITARALGAEGPWVIIEPPEGPFTLHVVTAAGAVRQDGEDPIYGLRLRGDAFTQYEALVRGLPSGVLVLMAVATPTFPRGSDWFEQRL